MMPNKDEVTISALYGETEDEVPGATCGDQVRLRIRGVEEEDILPGFVLCSPKRPVHCVSAFEAQIALLELKSILSAGFNCVLHVHSAIEEVTFAQLLHKLEKGTGRKSKKPPPFGKQGMSIIARLEVIGGAGRVCVEKYEDYAQMGRFTLRDQVRPYHLLGRSISFLTWLSYRDKRSQLERLRNSLLTLQLKESRGQNRLRWAVSNDISRARMSWSKSVCSWLIAVKYGRVLAVFL